jgi:hypothetical protein
MDCCSTRALLSLTKNYGNQKRNSKTNEGERSVQGKDKGRGGRKEREEKEREERREEEGRAEGEGGNPTADKGTRVY